MNKRAVLGFLIATVFPITGYLFVSVLSKDAAPMPRKFFIPDTVVTVEKRGKLVQDTIWHKVKSPQLFNQYGKPVNFDSARGKIIVLNFMFTRCPTVCPGLTRNMKRLQQSYKKTDSLVQFISVSVDPEHDSVPQLRKFADRFDANQDNWWFVSGDKSAIYDFANKELRANIADPKVDTAFIHTENFFLLDTNRIVRGFYNGFDTLKLAKLARDISLLSLEKDKNKPSFFRKFIPILPIIFIGIGIVFFLMLWFNNKRKNDELYA
jgi:protein SCO1